MHDGPAGGHYGREIIVQKILIVRYYWPMVFRDSHYYARKCKVCQTIIGRERKPAVFLRPLMIYLLFQLYGLDVIAEITPNSSQQLNYILIVTHYFTIWTEAIPLQKVNGYEVISFAEKFIINMYGILDALIFDNAYYFSFLKLTESSIDKSIQIKYAANYYP